MGLVTRLVKQGLRASPKKIPDASVGSVVFSDGKKVGKTDVRLYRHWSENSEWVRAAIDIRKGQLSAADWDIVPADPERPYSKRLKEKIRNLLETPNPVDESYQTLIEKVVEDILVLDAGSIEKVFSLDGQLRELYAVDGGQIRVSKVWDGDPQEARYFWWPDHRERATYLNRELIYIMQRPRTKSVVGLSNLEVLKRSIEDEIYGHDFNARQVTSAAGDGIFDLGENARPEQVDKFKSYWQAEVAGMGATAFWGGTRGAKWIPFRGNNKDMQFLEWQEYLVKKIAAVFEMHAQDLQMTNEVNKATSEVLDQQTDERGAKRLMRTVSGEITRQVVWDPSFGGRDNNLAFSFTKLNLRETLNHAKIDEIELAHMPSRSVNEKRMEKGLEPLPEEHFNWPMVITPTGAVSLRDVPTARELMESKNKGGESAPQEASA
jgi:hypothetical protein